MIAQLRGVIVERRAGSLVVEVGGVGYLVHVPGNATAAAPGAEMTLHTSLQVREDSMTLYGFAEPDDLALFELLLSSSGVGPRLALAALTTHRAPVLRAAIADGDEATLTTVPGIGRKVAQRLVLELQERVGPVEATVTDDAPSSGQVAVLDEVRAGLLGLGYAAAEADAALEQIEVTDRADAASLLRAALQALGSSR